MVQTAVVTGASRGLGLETCVQLANDGYDVVATSRDVAAGERALRGLRAPAGKLRAVALDVVDDASVRAASASLAENPGKIDVLVNNAGASFDGFDASVAARTLDTNYRGAVRVTDALSPLLASGARVVMVSSGMGEVSCLSRELADRFLDPSLTREGLEALVAQFVDDVRAGAHAKRGWPSNAYRVSKVAMNAFTRVVAKELTRRDIVVNAVCPGWVRTGMGGSAAPRSVEEGARSIVWAATKAQRTGGFYRDGRSIDW